MRTPEASTGSAPKDPDQGKKQGKGDTSGADQGKKTGDGQDTKSGQANPKQ